MSTYQIEGTVKLINDTATFGSGFTKREFVITTDDQYPQDIKLECIKDKCALLDSVNQGSKVNVSFRIRGNEYQGRYYVNLQAFKIDAIGGGGGNSGGGGGYAGGEPPAGTGDGVPSDPFAGEENPF